MSAHAPGYERAYARTPAAKAATSVGRPRHTHTHAHAKIRTGACRPRVAAAVPCVQRPAPSTIPPPTPEFAP